MLKALADNENAIHGTTDSNSLSADCSVDSSESGERGKQCFWSRM